jgi:ribose transport system substrate-binding protein
MTRREGLKRAGAAAGGVALAYGLGAGSARAETQATEEYLWLSASINLPLFRAHDHPALKKAGQDLRVKVSIVGPDTVDIPGLVRAVEESISRKPSGMMVVGWDQSALIPPINRAIKAGIPVVCVDADVPKSKRMAFIGTNWVDIGRAQGRAMVAALKGKKGKVGLIGLIDQFIDQIAFDGFREVAQAAGLTVLKPQHDKGNSQEAARIASALIQGNRDLVGLAGFDSQTGPGIITAIKEAGKTGKVIGTSVDAEVEHLRGVKGGQLAAAVGQRRELFTYYGVRALYDIRHNGLRNLKGAKAAKLIYSITPPVPSEFSTGTYTVTKANVDKFLKAA